MIDKGLVCAGCGKELEGTEPVYCHTTYVLFDWKDGWWRAEENQDTDEYYCEACEEEL